MGCTGSKLLRRRRGRSPDPYLRSHSLPIQYGIYAAVRRRNRDDHSAFAGTPSNISSFMLERGDLTSDDEAMMKQTNDRREAAAPEADVVKELGRSMTWSEMIESRIPKTPMRTPPNEPEVINAWELMADLEEASHLHPSPATAVDSPISFHTPRDAHRPSSERSSASSSPKLQAVQFSLVDSIVSDFDPEMLSSFRKALNDLPPQHQSHCILQPPELDKEDEDKNKESSHARTQPEESTEGGEVPKSPSVVQERINEFQQKINARKASSNANSAEMAHPHKCPPGGEGKVVLYFTTLRGIRKTYEDCWAIRVILKGYGVRVDERDVSMHAGFKEELVDILGPGYGGNRLPRVFADGNYVGGAEELRNLHEVGGLGELLESCEMVSLGKGGGGGVVVDASCEGCGDVRFVPCDTCSGSCKLYAEAAAAAEKDLGGFRRCPDCNENGLMRCPLCC